jgi:hypothetical protein
MIFVGSKPPAPNCRCRFTSCELICCTCAHECECPILLVGVSIFNCVSVLLNINPLVTEMSTRPTEAGSGAVTVT